MCARLIGLMGSISSGKSTSMRNLNPATTLYINYLGKDLPFKGSRKMYNKSPKEGGNIVNSPTGTLVPTLLTLIPELSKFKIGVVDDITYSMTDNFMAKAKQTGYNKFTELAIDFKAIIDAAKASPLDYVILILHNEPVYNGSEIVEYKLSSVGKLFDSVLKVEGLFTILLSTEVMTDEQGETVYRFVTNRTGLIAAKSPRGMLPLYMDNDLSEVIKLAEKYYNDED